MMIGLMMPLGSIASAFGVTLMTPMSPTSVVSEPPSLSVAPNVGHISAGVRARIGHRDDGAIDLGISAHVHDAADDRAGQHVVVALLRIRVAKIHVEVGREDRGLLDGGLVVERRRAREVQGVVDPIERLGDVGHNGAVEGAVFEPHVVGVGLGGVGLGAVDIQDVPERAVPEQGVPVDRQDDIGERLVLIHVAREGRAAPVARLGVVAGGVREILRDPAGRRGGGERRQTRLIQVSVVVGDIHAGHVIVRLAVADALVVALELIVRPMVAVRVVLVQGLPVEVEGIAVMVERLQVVRVRLDGREGAHRIDPAEHSGVAGRVERRDSPAAPGAENAPVDGRVPREPQPSAPGNRVVQDFPVLHDRHVHADEAQGQTVCAHDLCLDRAQIGVVAVEPNRELAVRHAGAQGGCHQLIAAAPGIREAPRGRHRLAVQGGGPHEGAQVRPHLIGLGIGHVVDVGLRQRHGLDQVPGAFES